MVTVIRRPSAGEEFGTALGEGLQMLAQHKLSQMHAQQQQQQRLSSLQGLGLDEQTAQAYSGLPDNVLGPLLKQQLRAQQLSQIEGLGGASVNANVNEPGLLERLSQGINTKQANSLSPEAITKATVIDPALGNALRAQASQVEQINQNKIANQLAQEKFNLSKTQAEENTEERNYKRNQPNLERIQKAGREADERIANNESVIHLAKTGGIKTGAWRQGLNKLGIGNILDTGIDNAIIAQMNKETSRWLEGSGARNLSESETRIIQSLNPNILMTPQGIVYLASNNVARAKLDRKEDQIRKKILKDNDNKTPLNISDQIEEKMAPHREHFAKVLKRNTAKLVDMKLPDVNKYPANKRLQHPVTGDIFKVVETPQGKSWALIENQSPKEVL